MPADDFVFSIVVDALCAGVPGGDPALRVEHEDGVVGGALDEQLQLVRIHLVNKLNALKKMHDDMQAEIDRLLREKERVNLTNTEIDAIREQIQREQKVVDDLGVRLGSFGPLPVRPPRTRAESRYHVRYLGGNGFEWTRSLQGEGGREVPVRELLVMPRVLVLGHGYLNEEPWTFAEAGNPNARLYKEVYAEIGFRVVLDQENSR